MSDNDVFDPKFLLDSVAGDDEIVTQVIEMFLSDMPDVLNDLDASIAEPDVSSAHRIAHMIKGSAATVGTELLRRAAEEGEELGSKGEVEAMKPVAEKIRREFEVAAAAMREFSKTHGA